MRMKKPFNCEAKKVFVKVKKIEMIAFSDYCTVESYVYIINIFYCPIDHRGLLMFCFFFVLFFILCVCLKLLPVYLVIMSLCI